MRQEHRAQGPRQLRQVHRPPRGHVRHRGALQARQEARGPAEGVQRQGALHVCAAQQESHVR